MNIKSYFTPTLILVLLSACAVRAAPTPSPSINNDGDVGLTPAVATSINQPPTIVLATNTPEPLPTVTSLITDTPTSPTWIEVDHWTRANQIRTMFIDRSGDLWMGGPAGIVHWNLATSRPTIYVLPSDPVYKNVIGFIQTPDGVIWAGTFGNGIVIFDHKGWHSLTAKNGLPGDYINSLTASETGEIWADIRKKAYPSLDGENYHFGRFDGQKWIDEFGGGFDWVIATPSGSPIGAFNYPFLGSNFSSEVAMYDGQAWSQTAYFPNDYIDAITVAPDGVVWIATDDHVFRLVGRTLYKIIPPWAGDFFPAVSSIAVAKDGTAWFGFSHASFLDYPCGSRSDVVEERGVYRYDGKTWTQFTTEDGLVDNKICAITLDSNGNTWFGSFDKGVSRFDGQEWKTYVIP